MDLKAGLAAQSVTFAAWTTATGVPVTVTSATAGLSLWYRRGVAGAKVAISVADLATLETAWASGKILVIEGAEHRLDLPDAAIAAGVLTVAWGGTATGITIDGGTANLIGQANSATDLSHVLGTAPLELVNQMWPTVIAAADLQKIAQIEYGTSGTVWFASPAGLSGNSGLAASAPKPILDVIGSVDNTSAYTPGLMAIGDVVVLSNNPESAGMRPVFDLGVLGILPPPFSRVVGSANIRSSILANAGSFNKGILNISQGCQIDDLEVVGAFDHTATSPAQYGISCATWGNFGRTVLQDENEDSSVLSTRISDSAGVITLTGITSPVGYQAGDFILLSWNASGYKYRYESQITNVVTNGLVETITFVGGFGYKLPAVSSSVFTSLTQLKCRNIRLRHVTTSDCLFGMYADYGYSELIGNLDGHDSSNVILDECAIRGRMRGIHFDHGGSVLELWGSTVEVEAGARLITNDAVGVYCAVYGGQGGNVLKAYDSKIAINGHSSAAAHALHFDFSGGIFDLKKTTLLARGGSVNRVVYEAPTKTNTLRLVGCEYDPTAISMAAGTFTDEGRIIATTGNAHAVDSSGNAIPTVAQITDDIDAYSELLAAAAASSASSAEAAVAVQTLTQAGGAGDLAEVAANVAETLAGSGALTIAERNAVADALLGRAAVNAEATADDHSLATVILAISKKSNTIDNPGFLTVYRTDGVTEHVRIPISTDANANPIDGIG